VTGAAGGAVGVNGNGVAAGHSPALTGRPLLEGKRLLITGVVTKSSIAFAVAQAAQLAGAEVLLTGFDRALRLTERAARRLPEPADVIELDVNRPEHLRDLTTCLEGRWGRVDGVLHAIAYAPPGALGGNFLHTSMEDAETAFRTGAYSLKALAEATAPLMTEGGSIVALDFDATKAWAMYDWMGVAKAGLESVCRYLSLYLGPRGIRVNLVASGPLETLAATSLPGYQEHCDSWARRAPLGWDTTAAGAVAEPICFLFSDLARALTGELVHVDGGYNAIATSQGIPAASGP
jgi:enoyl-[acyl-carrier protein] reductase I